MATTTPQFGWAVPTSTDLVKDGALAIETLGDAIDARFGNLATYPNQIVNVVSGVSRPIPFAMSAGTAAPVWTANANAANITVTFAASRFTQAPMITITNNASTGSLIGSTYRAFSVTSASFTLASTAVAATSVTGSAFWVAVQMTSASASN